MKSLIPDPDSNDGSPPEPRSRWSRRRGFYLALVVMCFGGLWGGWYRADFPVPRWVYSDGFHYRFPNAFEWMLNQRIDLIRWKGHRHLRAILKESPVWGERPFFHPSEAAVLEFGANGQFRWIQSPKALGKLDGSRDPIVDELHWVDYRLLDSWDGSAGDFFDDHIFNSMDGNLYVEFPDHPRWMGYLKYKDPSSPPFGEGPSLDFWVIPADIDDEIAEGMGSIILMGLKPRKNQ